MQPSSSIEGLANEIMLTLDLYSALSAATTAHDVSAEPRDQSGKWTRGVGGSTRKNIQPQSAPPKDVSKVSWRKSQGSTKDRRIMEAVKQKAESKGFIVEVEPTRSGLTKGVLFYTITIYHPKKRRGPPPLPKRYSADCDLAKYVAMGFRSRGLASSPGQQTFDFESRTTKPSRNWGFRDEQLHPRGRGGKFTKKNHDPTPPHPLPLFDRTDEINDLRSQVEEHQQTLEKLENKLAEMKGRVYKRHSGKVRTKDGSKKTITEINEQTRQDRIVKLNQYITRYRLKIRDLLAKMHASMHQYTSQSMRDAILSIYQQGEQ